MNAAPPTHRDLKALVFALVLGAVAFHLGLAVLGRGVGRDQHLGTAVLYAQSGIDFLHPVIVGANANGAPTPLEVPVWQALVALPMKAFGVWYGWGNVVSLLFYAATFWPVFWLARSMFTKRVAWWAVLLFAAQPLTFLYGGYASTDSMSVCFAIWFAWCAWRLLETGSWRWWAGATVTGVLSATTKVPFFFVVGLAAGFWLMWKFRSSKRAWFQLATVGLFSALAFVAWQRHCTRCYALAEFPAVELTVSKGKPILTWWFGDLVSRFAVKEWAKGAWRATHILFGSLVLAVLPLTAFFFRGTGALRLWLLAGGAAMLVFTNLVLIHWHYYYIFAVPVAVLGALALVEFEPVLTRITRGQGMRIAVVGVMLVASLVQGIAAARINLWLDPFPARAAETIRQNTAPSDKLVLWGGVWSVPLFRSQRQGVDIANFANIENPASLQRLLELGYNRLVLVGPSPLMTAVGVVNGLRPEPPKPLRTQLPEVARSWRATYESESVLILEIPR